MNITTVKTDVLQLLVDLYEYLDDYADVNTSDDELGTITTPNTAMSLQQRVNILMMELEDQ